MAVKKMDKKWKKKWVKALRSGKYKQGMLQLKTPIFMSDKYQYCCLGVLCEVIDPTKWNNGIYRYISDGDYIVNTTDYESRKYDYESRKYIPYKLANKLGITPTQQEKMGIFNDDKGKSFNWIASYIERYM